jgi:hypothetical protein
MQSQSSPFCRNAAGKLWTYSYEISTSMKTEMVVFCGCAPIFNAGAEDGGKTGRAESKEGFSYALRPDHAASFKGFTSRAIRSTRVISAVSKSYSA